MSLYEYLLDPSLDGGPTNIRDEQGSEQHSSRYEMAMYNAQGTTGALIHQGALPYVLIQCWTGGALGYCSWGLLLCSSPAVRPGGVRHCQTVTAVLCQSLLQRPIPYVF